MPVEFTPVDFVRLMDVADRRLVPEGQHLTEEGKLQEDVFLIVDGTAEVRARMNALLPWLRCMKACGVLAAAA